MPIRYSNLSFTPSINIERSLLIDSNEMTPSNFYLLIKATFEELDSSYKLGRTIFQLPLEYIKSDLTLTFYNLLETNLDIITLGNINNYLGEIKGVKSVSSSNDLKYITFDISNFLASSNESFTISFALQFNINGRVSIASDLDNRELIIGELYNLNKETFSTEFLTQDLGRGGVGQVDLYKNSLTVNLLNIETSGKEKVSVSAFYNEIVSGLLGENITLNFEYSIVKEEDFIEIINNLGNSSFYIKMTKQEVKEKYNLEVEKNIVYLNLCDFSYITILDKIVTLINKDNTRVRFYTKNNIDSIKQPLYIESITNKLYKIVYERNLSYQVLTIKANDDNKITFSYDLNGLITRIDYDNKKYVKFTYITKNAKKYLEKIEYCDNCNPSQKETIINIFKYEYNDLGKLTLFYDDLTKIGYEYLYQNDVLLNVSKVIKDTTEKEESTYVLKNNSLVSVINDVQKIDYYFDCYGRCYMKIDDDGNSAEIKYIEQEIGCISKLSETSKMESNNENLLLNGNFKLDDDGNITSWNVTSINPIEFIETNGYNNEVALYIDNTFNSQIVLSQTIKVKEINEKFKLKGVVRGEGTIEVIVNGKEETTKRISAYSMWQEFTIDDISLTKEDVNIQVIIFPTSSLKITNFYFYKEESSEKYNYIKNGKFNNNTLNWEVESECQNKITNAILLGLIGKIFTKQIDLMGGYLLQGFSQTLEINGKAGDELTLSFFTKADISINDICYYYIEVNYTLLGIKTYTFNIDQVVKEYKKIVQSIILESSYTSIKIGIKYMGDNDIYFSEFGVYCGTSKTYYSYDKTNTLKEIQKRDSNVIVEYDPSFNIKRISDNSGEVFEYNYNDNKTLEKIKDSSGNEINYEYDENNNLKKTTLKTRTNKTQTSEQKVSKKGNLLEEKDYRGNVTLYDYDDKNRIVVLNKSSGEVNHFKYDDKDKLVQTTYDIETDAINHKYTYDNKNRISKVIVDEKSIYNYSLYDEWGNLKQVILDNKELNSFTYLKTNGISTGLLQSKVYPNGTYYFNYDEKLRLKTVTISINNIVSTVVEYFYNKDGNLVKRIDLEGTTYYYYDDNNLKIKEEIKTNKYQKTILTEYDNLNQLQEKSIRIDDDTLTYNYVYDYEYNEYKRGGYFSRLETSFNEDILFESMTMLYGGKLENISTELVDDNDLNLKVIRFINSSSKISIDTNTINSLKELKTNKVDSFNKEEWDKEFSKRKEVMMWIKVGSLSQNENDINIFSFNSSEETIASIKVANNGLVKFIYDGEVRSNIKIIPKSWTLVGLTLEEVDQNKVTVGCLVNDFLHTVEIEVNKIKQIEKLVLGNNEANTQPINMPFDILYMGVGAYKHTLDSYKAIYNEGYKYIFRDEVKSKSGVIYYNHDVFSEFDVIPLNGNLTSSKGLKPVEYTYSAPTFSKTKTKLFKLDRKKNGNDTNYTSRHSYGSYTEDIDLSGKSKSMLCYDLGLKKEGTISLRFKCDSDVSKTSNYLSRTIFSSLAPNLNKLSLSVYIDALNETLKVAIGSNTYETNLGISFDIWHQLIISWNEEKIYISLDNKKQILSGVNSFPDLTNSKTYIGCNYINNTLSRHLQGSIEMFSYSHNYIEDTSRIINDGKPISVLKEYDEVNRQVTKEINTGTKTLTHKYIYNDENEVINPLLTMEVLPTSEQIIYSYDRSGNITHKITIENEAIKESIFYKYDVSGRLINEKCYEGNNFKYDYEYKIDSNDDILEKIMYNNSGSIIEREVYTYSNTIKNQLLNIKTINSNNEVIEIKEITYEETDPFRPSTYKGNILTWASRRLETYGSNSYRYNSEGIRISKETIEGLYTYIVDQDKIITEIKPNNKKVYYHYDEQNMLVGFSYGTNEYFYIRDITGNIIHIIDKYGNIKVTYKYDAYGKVVKEEGNSELIEINSYLYKGYYYDKETSLYYCNSRYYDPEVKRFISIDDISYLDIETIGGINLYAYCMNNPIMYADPSGHFAISLTMLGLIIGAVVGATAGGIVAYNIAKDHGAEGWELFGWTMAGIVGGGVIGGALGAGVGAIVTKATGVIGLSITKYSIIPIKGTTVLGNMPGYIAAAEATGSGYYLVSNGTYDKMVEKGVEWLNNMTYIKDAHTLGSKFALVPDYVVQQGRTFWQEIQYLIENGIPWELF